MKMLIKNKFVRIILAFLIIYVVWSACIDIFSLNKYVDNEALVPCLFYLPPLGFLALGIVAFKIIESTFVLTFMKKIFRKKN